MHYRSAHHQSNPKLQKKRNASPVIPLSEMSDSSTKRSDGQGNIVLSIKLLVLIILSLQNSLFTVLRRYSQGVLKENYSKYELLLLGEIIKITFSSYMVLQQPPAEDVRPETVTKTPAQHFHYLVQTSGKMVGLAAIYGAMNILSFVSLRNIGAGLFTIFAQTKILTTAVFSTIILNRSYSTTKWRALLALSLGVLLFSEPVWNKADIGATSESSDVGNTVVGVGAVIIEVTLSGFASIYFEKVIKTDPTKLNIWERNFQLALVCFPWLTFDALSHLRLLTGEHSSLYHVYHCERRRSSRLSRRLVMDSLVGCHIRCCWGTSCCSIHQIWRCHSENSCNHCSHYSLISH